uniref:Glycosyltransferase 2-like domain-containing protein n=1 Tax=viral metagenome TaxID=1070528 RepID=A0A6C0KC99_9ZZZZ
MAIEIIEVKNLSKFRPNRETLYIIIEGSDLNELDDPTGQHFGYPENTVFCGFGHRLRATEHIPVVDGWVELVDMTAGVLIPGCLLDKTITKVPKGMPPGVWISAWLRHKLIPVYKTPGVSTTGPTPGPESLAQFDKCLESLGHKFKMSILTPTYNRHDFLERLMECVKAQLTKVRHEWCILDDSPQRIPDAALESLRKAVSIPVYYVWLSEKIPVGNKRNILSGMATGWASVNFDDDDFHHPERIKHSLFRMEQKKASLVGSSRCLLYLNDVIYQLRGFGPNHSTGGLMAFTKEYCRDHLFGEDIPNAEEAAFTNKFTVPMAQLDANKVILIMSHSRNTYDKTAYVARSLGKTLDATKLGICNYTKNKRLRKIFAEAFDQALLSESLPQTTTPSP